MAFNGSGTFTRETPSYSGVTAWAQEELGGYGKVAVRHDFHDQGFAGGLSNCLTKDGQTTPTGNIQLGGVNAVNLGIPTARGSLAQAGAIQDGNPYWCGSSTSSGIEITVAQNIGIAMLVDGLEIYFHVAATYNTQTKLKLGSLPSYPISRTREGGAVLPPHPNDLLAGSIAHFVFSSALGGIWVMISDRLESWTSWTPTISWIGGDATTSISILLLVQAKYAVRDGRCLWSLVIGFGLTGAACSEAVVSLPIPCTNENHVSIGRLQDIFSLEEHTCRVRVSQSGIATAGLGEDLTTPISSSYGLYASGIYETA